MHSAHIESRATVVTMQTSPVLACRRAGPSANVRGSIGLPIPETSLRVVDPTTLEDVVDGEQGLVLARGPGIMRGYRNDPENTQTAMRAGSGYFDTGDLGWRAPSKALSQSIHNVL